MIGEFIYMLPSDMNLRIGKVKNYNNKILISSPSFKIGTNLKINFDGEQAKLKDKPDVKSKEVEMVKTEPDVKLKVIAEPNIKPNEKHEQDVKPNIESNKELKHDTNKITNEGRKGSFDIGNYSCIYSMVDVQMTYLLLVFVMKYVYIKTPPTVISAHKFCDNQPTTSLALFKIHEVIKPMIPGSDANAFVS